MAWNFNFYLFIKNKLLLKLLFCLLVFTIVTILMAMKSIFKSPINHFCLYQSCSNENVTVNEKHNFRTISSRKKYMKKNFENIYKRNISNIKDKNSLLAVKKSVVNRHKKHRLKMISFNGSNNLKKKEFHSLTKNNEINLKLSTNYHYGSHTTLPWQPWYLQPDKLENLNKNIVYENLKIPKAKKRIPVNIILIVSSAPSRIDRRFAIRRTWWTQCKSTSKISIKCVFLTDWKDPSSNSDNGNIVDLQLESDRYRDIHFQNLTGGYDFGKRFLYHMVWAMQNFKFDYFLRLDDDYFLCLERFLYEVPMPPKKLYHWGWVHCINELVRPEESIILLSNDLIERFLGQDPERMLCHRWADQMIGIWVNNIYLPGFQYKHDNRLHHDPPAMFIENFKTQKNICNWYIGIHGSYPKEMMTLWRNRGLNNYNKNKTLDDYSEYCMYNQYMNWDLFENEWHAMPMLCKEDPSWGGALGTLYHGRQGQVAQV